jgi:hypothetical protein
LCKFNSVVASKPEGYKLVGEFGEDDMQAVAIFIAISAAIFLPLALVLSGEQCRAEQDRLRARRIAEARMNARLLRLNI